MNTTSDPAGGSDVELWQRVLAEDTAAFQEVVVKYQSLIASVAYSSTGHFSLSEEVTQETFWQAWRQRFQLRDHERLGSWLCKIARNIAAQMSKKERRHHVDGYAVDVGSSQNDPALNSISAEERQLVWRTLEEIPETYREALVLYYRAGQSMAEVALALDISNDLAKQRVHRGRELLRATLANRVEDVLIRSRPGQLLTTRVMIGLAALTASLKATSAATAATAGAMTGAISAKSLAANSLGGVTASSLKSTMIAGGASGVLGSLVGIAGGLGGALLGCWLPAQLANTLDERKLLEKHGRRSFGVALALTLGMVLATPLLSLTNGLVWYFSFVSLITLVFVIGVVSLGKKAQAEIRALQASLPPDAQLNPSRIRRTIGLDKYIYRGRRYTSCKRLLGIPLLDVQFNDGWGAECLPTILPRRAYGWIAIGDHATGVLFAAGGMAKGLIAVGGLAIGGVAFGGCAIGGLAIGGGAVGWLAFGGGAIGYDAVGGLAIAWQVATGGGAIAYHLAVGGGAWAYNYAVGGGAWAREANTQLAKQLAETQSMMWMLEWLTENRVLFITATSVVSLMPTFLLRFAFRRELRQPENIASE